MKLEWQQPKTFSRLKPISLITAKDPFSNYIHTQVHGASAIYICCRLSWICEIS